jgi:hypothetical protein
VVIETGATESRKVNQGVERLAAPRAVARLHLTKISSWMVQWDLNIEIIFLQLGSMSKDDREHYGLNHKSTRYKLHYLRNRGLISEDEFQALDWFRRYLERLLHDKAERTRWIGDESDGKREAIKEAERALELSRDVMLRLPRQLKMELARNVASG